MTSTFTKNRIRVLVLIKGLNLGGAERLLVDALPYLDQQQFDYHFAYLLPWSNFLVPQFERLGFPIYCLGMPSNSRLLEAFPALGRLQRQHAFNLVHAHLPMSGLLARVFGRVYGLPVVYTEHNLLEHFHPLMRWATKLTYRWNDRVFAVSQSVFNSIVSQGMHHKTQVSILLNGVPVEQVRVEAFDIEELRQEFEIPPDHLVVGTVAVLTKQKRLDDWLDVAREVAEQRRDVTFVLAGAGPEYSSLKARLDDLGLDSRVKMPGFRADGRRILGMLDVYLMTSAYEGLPIALLEAMALGKPVVSTAVGGIPEVVKNSVHGFLGPPGAIDELAQAVLFLLNERGYRSKMGREGARTIEEEYHLRTRIQMVEDVYSELIER